MNDPKTAAQHNAPQTGEAYSILTNAEIELIRERMQRYTNQDHLDAVKLLLAERGALMKQRDALSDRLSVIKARNLLQAIRWTCEKCGHDNNEDGCAHCLREQVTKLREALQYIGGKTDHGHSPHGRCIICATVDKALTETEPR